MEKPILCHNMIEQLIRFIIALFFPRELPFPGMNHAPDGDELPDDGLTMGTLYLGRQGTGKTTSLARHLVDYMKRYPKRAIFVLDWSGSLTDTLLQIIVQSSARQQLLDRTIYDPMGHAHWVVPLPEFSDLYGLIPEEHVNRVSTNLIRLNEHLVKGAPFLAGLGLEEVFPQACRLLIASRNEYGESWQITESKQILTDKSVRTEALQAAGNYVSPEARTYFELLYDDLSNRERELRTYAVKSLMGAVDPVEMRARFGYHTPGWTPKEAIQKGLLVLIDGSRLINRARAQHYAFVQAYSLIMAEINKRQPANPNDEPVSLVMDEVYSLIQIPGMAPEISKLSPQYRSRKLQLYIVLQELAQMAEDLRPHIWSLGNVISFALSNFNDGYEIAQQLFKYEAQEVKAEGRTEMQNPVFEPDRGQYLQIANWMQRLDHRACIVRRYESEQMLDGYVRYVPQTKEIDAVHTVSKDTLEAIKEDLVKRRGIRIRDALEVVNSRPPHKRMMERRTIK